MESTTVTFSNPTEEINHLREQNRQLEALVETLQNTVLKQQHQLEGLIKRLYGRSSEKLDPNQLLMQELILEADQNTAQKIEDPLPVVATTTVAAHVRNHHGRQKLPEHLKRVEHVLDVHEEKKVCGCGKKLVHIGDDITERLDYQPSSLLVNSYVRPKYACGDSRCDGCGVKQHPTPEGPIERCEADAGLLAYVITEKYNHHTPLYRIEEKLEREGVNIRRQTMADWMAGCALELTPLYELMRDKVLEYDIVGNDDTPLLTCEMAQTKGYRQQGCGQRLGVETSNIRYSILQQTVVRKAHWNSLRITKDSLCLMLMLVMADWVSRLR